MAKCVVILDRSPLASLVRERLQQARDVVLLEVTDTMPSAESLAQHLPPLLVLGHTLAWRSDGLAFVEHFRTLSPETEFRVLPESGMAASHVVHGANDIAAPGLVAASFPLPRVPARRSLRRQMPSGTKALVNGQTAFLIDLSPFGAQVLVPSVLRPAQQVSFSLADRAQDRIRGAVAWSMYELRGPGGRPHFRAGLAFHGRLSGLDEA